MAAKRKEWSDVSMATAVEQVQKQELSLREASRMYNVPLETLRRRVNGTVAVG
jgi:predicted HTH domain antitoxin